jgi:1-acyl-sn-glycerol-3-phosphate acyltransferase
MIPQLVESNQTPDYRVPRRLVANAIWAALVMQPRSFAHDSRWALEGLYPPLRLLGKENIPYQSPCLVACNHYSRPGFDAWWIAMAISAAVAANRAPEADPEIQWVMTGAWTFPESRWKRRYITPLTRWAFRRVARAYGFVSMPPMPPSPEEVEERAAAVLRTVRLARHAAKTGGMIGLAPEGQDNPEGLDHLPSGVGRFIALLVQAGLPVLPSGVAEQDGRLQVSFGPVFTPQIPSRKSLQDDQVAPQVMAAIARQIS